MHSTDNLNDGYIGSGKRLWYSINKHGKENHVCEIQEHYFTREWLRAREAELVCAETLTDPMCMNIKLGGDGGWNHVHFDKSNLSSVNLQAYLKSDELKEHLKRICHLLTPEKRSQNAKKAWSENYSTMYETALKGVTAMASPSAAEKRKATFSEMKHSQGEKNSQFGTCWVYSATAKVCKKISKVDLEQYLCSGWSSGRKMKFP